MILATGDECSDVCNICWKGWTYYGEICPAYYLISKDDKFLVISYNAHTGSEVFDLKNAPTPQPISEEQLDDDDLCDELFNIYIKWFQNAEEILIFRRNDVVEIVDFYNKCKEVGYDEEESNFYRWVVNRMGEMVRDEENGRCSSDN